jgi:DNA-binding CsgD family transcriptional regulator
VKPNTPPAGEAPAGGVLICGRRSIGRVAQCSRRPVSGGSRAISWISSRILDAPVLERMLAQLTAQQRPIDIARGLCVALSTVRSHIASIRSKTGASSIRELIQLMARLPPLTGHLLH